MNGKPFKYNRGTKYWDKQTDKSATKIASTVANLAPGSRFYMPYVTLWLKNMIKTLHRHRKSYYNCIGSLDTAVFNRFKHCYIHQIHKTQ